MILDFILNFVRNTAGLIFIVSLVVFAEMFVAKKWFTSFTHKIENVKARRALNILLGVFTSFVLCFIHMFAICDVAKAEFAWLYVFASAFIVTQVYLVLEKVFSESEINELGYSLCAMINKSDAFEGEISKDNIVKISKEFLGKIAELDLVKQTIAKSKEATVVDAVIDRLKEIVADGNVTADERAEAEAIVSGRTDLAGNTFYEKAKALLK